MSKRDDIQGGKRGAKTEGYYTNIIDFLLVFGSYDHILDQVTLKVTKTNMGKISIEHACNLKLDQETWLVPDPIG